MGKMHGIIVNNCQTKIANDTYLKLTMNEQIERPTGGYDEQTRAQANESLVIDPTNQYTIQIRVFVLYCVCNARPYVFSCRIVRSLFKSYIRDIHKNFVSSYMNILCARAQPKLPLYATGIKAEGLCCIEIVIK